MMQLESKNIRERGGRKIHIDIMRIVAMFAVIFNHTGEVGYAVYSKCRPGSLSFWFHLGCAVCCKFAVPLFFMISGALMLGKRDETIRTVYRRRVLRYVLILFFISVFYAVSHHILYGDVYTVRSFLRMIYTSSLKYHLGFLYAYISFLVALPLLRAFSSGMENRHYLYLSLVYLCICLLPVMQYLAWKGSASLNSNIYPSLSGCALVFPMVGYFCEHRVSEQSVRKHLWMIWLINIVCIVLVCAATFIRGTDLGTFEEDKSQVFFEGLSWVNAAAVYLTCRCLFSRVIFKERIQNIIMILSRESLGIYLFHPLMKNLLDLHITDMIRALPLHPEVRTWVYVLSIFGTSFVFVWILRYIFKHLLLVEAVLRKQTKSDL